MTDDQILDVIAVLRDAINHWVPDNASADANDARAVLAALRAMPDDVKLALVYSLLPEGWEPIQSEHLRILRADLVSAERIVLMEAVTREAEAGVERS